MQPTYIPIATLFGAQTRHTVPLFQRPYVWSKEEQWEPLWEDLSGLLERLEARQGATAVACHFLGTIVLDQSLTNTGSLPRREVIDGQQRLTTLQIMLKAVEHALAEAESAAPEDQKGSVSVARRQLNSLTENPAFSDEEERYKVWPTNEDRSPFRAVLDAKVEAGVGDQGGRMADAYRYFRGRAADYLRPDAVEAPPIGTRAQLLATALKDHLKIIVLDLEPSDEPQAIFETLNAHGTPLLPADLIKNWFLWEATRQNLDRATLYDRFWRQFDSRSDYWRERIGTGHAARARVDTFLQNWLTKETLEPVSAKHLYDRFLRHVRTLAAEAPNGRIDVDALMSGIREDAERYERIDSPGQGGGFDRFLRRLKVLDVVVLHPVLLALMGRPGSGQDDLEEAGRALESYLVRRMICGEQTRGYGALALRLLKVMADVSVDSPVAGVIRDELRSPVSGADAWPDDALFRSEWLRRRFYGGLRRDRVLMILQAIEEAYQAAAHKAEPLMSFNWSKLQIEHIMPQKWHANWPLEDEERTAEERDFALHGIGNLTLVSASLNPSLSNGPWEAIEGNAGKRAALGDHSKLELNHRLLKAHHNWNEDRMRVRAEELFDEACRIWPPAAPVLHVV